MDGLRYLPRADAGEKYGFGVIVRYKILVSNDAKNWEEVAVGGWINEPGWKVVNFEERDVKYVRLMSVDSIGDSRIFSSAAEIRLTSVDVKKALFYLGTENFSFTNSPKEFLTSDEYSAWNVIRNGGTTAWFYANFLKEEGINVNYQITDNSFSKLTRKMGQDVVECLWSQRNTTWGGSCFGMSVVMAIRAADPQLLPVEKINPENQNIQTTYQLNAPNSSWRTEDIINYYQLMYHYPYFLKRELSLSESTKENYEQALNTFLGTLENDNALTVACILSVDKKGKPQSAHAVIVVGVEKENDEYYELKIYDPNEQEFTYMYLYKENASNYVEAKVNYSTLRIKYNGATTAVSEEMGYSCLYNYTDSIETLDLRNYFDSTKDYTYKYGGKYYEAPIITVEGETDIILGSETEKLCYKNGHIENAQNIYGPFMTPGNNLNGQAEYRFTVNTASPADNYTISFEPKQDVFNASVYMPSCSVLLSSPEDLVINMNNISSKVSIESDISTTFSTLVSWDNDSDSPGSLIAIDAKDSTRVSICPVEDKIVLNGDNLGNADISIVSDDEVISLDYEGEADSVVISKDEYGKVIVEDEMEKDMLEGITRLYGSTRYETSYAIASALKQQLGVERFDTVILANGNNFPDALAGSYLASIKDAPILMARENHKDSLHEFIKNNLNIGGTIYVLGGTGAIPESVLSGLSSYNVKRLSGQTRYETNLLILEEAGVTNEDILVCTGNAFADSLSASAVGKPILLLNNKKITEEQKAFLEEHVGNRYYIIGGTGAVSQEMENEIAKYGAVERVYGLTRYETSIKVAEKFFDNPEDIVLAYAKNFPDGLCGGPLANKMNAPLILTAEGKIEAAEEYVRENNIHSGKVLGGDGVLPNEAIKEIFHLPEDTKI